MKTILLLVAEFLSRNLSNRPPPHRMFNLRVVAVLLTLVCCWCGTAWAQYTGLTLPKGYVQVQGDIITTEERAAELLAEMQGTAIHPASVFAPSRLWPNRVVPYDFDAGVTAQEQTVFVAAMSEWANSFPGVTTITFRPRQNEAGYLHFVVGDPGFCGGSTDNVGYNGGKVTITVSKATANCTAITTFLIAHEIGHALGLWHEQSRNDRDSYVTILSANIQSGESDQFAKASPQSTFGEYDYDSIMHYFACAFSKCDGKSGRPNCGCFDSACETIQVVSQYSGQQCNIGQQNHLSAMDRRTTAFRYGPPDWKFLYSKAGSSASGSFEQPYTSVSQVISGAPAGSTLWLGPETFAASGRTFRTPMTLRAAIPDLRLQSDGSLGPSSSGYATLR